jgi:hypothetical protein
MDSQLPTARELLTRGRDVVDELTDLLDLAALPRLHAITIGYTVVTYQPLVEAQMGEWHADPHVRARNLHAWAVALRKLPNAAVNVWGTLRPAVGPEYLEVRIEAILRPGWPPLQLWDQLPTEVADVFGCEEFLISEQPHSHEPGNPISINALSRYSRGVAV